MANDSLLHRLPATAIAFRGYNVTNLGRTGELLAQRSYGPTVERHLRTVSAVAADTLHRPVDLVEQVRLGKESTLETYGEALALVLAVESAQLELLEQFFKVDYRLARMSFGF